MRAYRYNFSAWAIQILFTALLTGCVAPYVWEPPVPPQPTPNPTPEPTKGLTRASFDAVTVGAQADVLNDLPPADASVNVGGRQILSWDLNEARPTGGYVQWEVHIEGGEIVASHAW